VIPRRPSTRYLSTIPAAGGRVAVYEEPVSRELIWYELRGVQENAKVGLAMMTGTTAERRHRWNVFRSFIRQAKANDDAASLMHGSSAALLNYYTALNLAKAGLLVSDPTQVVGARLGHGLSYDPTTGATVKSDFLTVKRGVFPMLYKLHTGQPLAPNTKLPIKQLLTLVPETSSEVEAAGFGKIRTMPMYHTTVFNETEAWSLLAIFGANDLMSHGGYPAIKHLEKSYRRVNPPGEWRELFSFSTRTTLHGTLAYYESKDTTPFSLGSMVPESAWSALHPYIDNCLEAHRDAVFCPGLYSSKAFPMPASLARYALMFYVSSLVRYRPDWLDPYLHGAEGWMLDSVTELGALQLLAASFDRIMNRAHRYNSGAAFRL